MADLFRGSDSDSDDVGELKLNKDYAKSYNKWREKEELQKLKDKYGDDVTLDSSSSSSESEDEDAEELTPTLEKKFLETLSALKSKDPKIYDKDIVFFEPTGDVEGEPMKEKQKKEKPMFLKDYKRKLIVEKQGMLSDEEDVTGDSPVQHKQGHFATAAEEEHLRRSFKAALADFDDDEDDDGSLLQTAKHSKELKAEADEEYKKWLKGEVDKIHQKKDVQKLGYLHDYWNSSNLDKAEEFLRDYILNKRYLEKSRLPVAQPEDNEDLSADEATLEEQEAFEHKFNYRFEEPDSEFIKKYPRTMQDSMRRKDDRRKVKRLEVRERKLQEKEQKKEEINRLKALKKKEILEKLEKLKEVTGNDQLGIADADIEGDFDPQEHDRRMNAIFNNEYYEQEAEELKPEDPLDEELGLEDWDQWQGGEGEEANEEGGEDEQDWSQNDDVYPGYEGDAGENQDDSEWTGETKGKRRKKSHFAKVVSRKKPLFDPSSKTFEEYFDEYYKLDFEDIVGGMPTRFRYRSVIPNDFGLTTEEILAAKDKELNRWCSVKKTCQYRTENEEMQDLRTFQRRATNDALKRKIFPSLYAEPTETSETPSEEPSKKKRRRKKKSGLVNGRAASGEHDDTLDTMPTAITRASSSDVTAASKKRQKRKTSTHAESLSGNSDPQPARLIPVNDDDCEPSKKFKSDVQNLSTELGQGQTTSRSGDIASKDGSRQMTANPDMSASKKRKKKLKGVKQSLLPRQNVQVPALKVSDNRLKAYGLNPKKLKKQLIYGKKKDSS
ncbi:protein KRI1 homolog [Rhipicephalus sanguineus]|uniref:protein KRI1 homolog n=1 Tax=Rhipicephalus sanguineus TaxID=34632 RepID=UPI0018954B64|nr:protein KRI1 homolog [Rhipicephalus sanguineus]